MLNLWGRGREGEEERGRGGDGRGGRRGEQRRSEKRRAKEGELVSYEGPTLIEKNAVSSSLFKLLFLLMFMVRCLEVLFTCLYFAFCCF